MRARARARAHNPLFLLGMRWVFFRHIDRLWAHVRAQSLRFQLKVFKIHTFRLRSIKAEAIRHTSFRCVSECVLRRGWRAKYGVKSE